MSTRIDKATKRVYTYHNIPCDKGVYCIQTNGKLFKIFAENHSHPEDSWYNGMFMGDRYAVFVWSGSCYQQITIWYERFGNAQRQLKKMAYR